MWLRETQKAARLCRSGGDKYDREPYAVRVVPN